MFNETETQQFHSPQTQIQIQQEETDVQALAERERAIRQLEVTFFKSSENLWRFN